MFVIIFLQNINSRYKLTTSGLKWILLLPVVKEGIGCSQQGGVGNIVLLKWLLDRSEYLLRLKPFRKFANSWRFDRRENRDSSRENQPANERTVFGKYDNS